MRYSVDIVRETYGAVDVEANSYEEALEYVGKNFQKFINSFYWNRYDEDVLRVCDTAEEHSIPYLED